MRAQSSWTRGGRCAVDEGTKFMDKGCAVDEGAKCMDEGYTVDEGHTIDEVVFP